MRATIAIFKRELLSFFVSPIAYIVITGFILLCGYFFFNLLQYYNLMLIQYSQMPYRMPDSGPSLNSDVIAPYYQTMMVVLVFLIPALTMKSISEEKRSGTFELLAISPISVGSIIFGKFLATATVMALMLLGCFAFPALLAIYGDPEFWPMVSGILGLLLYSLGFIAVGMAVSSFTQNQMIAAVSSIVVLLLLYLIHAPAQSVGGTAGDVMMYISPAVNTVEMIKGVIESNRLIYFVSLISFGLFLSLRSLEAQRWR